MRTWFRGMLIGLGYFALMLIVSVVVLMRSMPPRPPGPEKWDVEPLGDITHSAMIGSGPPQLDIELRMASTSITCGGPIPLEIVLRNSGGSGMWVGRERQGTTETGTPSFTGVALLGPDGEARFGFVEMTRGGIRYFVRRPGAGIELRPGESFGYMVDLGNAVSKHPFDNANGIIVPQGQLLRETPGVYQAKVFYYVVEDDVPDQKGSILPLWTGGLTGEVSFCVRQVERE